MSDGPFEYIRLVFQVWWSRKLSGPVLAAVGLALVAAQLVISDAPTAAKLTALGGMILLGTAALVVLVAMYEVWQEERRRYQREASKNARPEIKGLAYNFVAGQSGETQVKGEWHCYTALTFELTVSNHRQVTTNLAGLRVSGDGMKLRVDFSGTGAVSATEYRGKGDGVLPVGNPTLSPGIATGLRANTMMVISGVRLAELGPVDMAGLRVYLIDGFGDEHMIDIRSAESVTLS